MALAIWQSLSKQLQCRAGQFKFFLWIVNTWMHWTDSLRLREYVHFCFEVAWIHIFVVRSHDPHNREQNYPNSRNLEEFIHPESSILNSIGILNQFSILCIANCSTPTPVPNSILQNPKKISIDATILLTFSPLTLAQWTRRWLPPRARGPSPLRETFARSPPATSSIPRHSTSLPSTGPSGSSKWNGTSPSTSGDEFCFHLFSILGPSS